jgi:hypothetical protein
LISRGKYQPGSRCVRGWGLAWRQHHASAVHHQHDDNQKQQQQLPPLAQGPTIFSSRLVVVRQELHSNHDPPAPSKAEDDDGGHHFHTPRLCSPLPALRRPQNPRQPCHQAQALTHELAAGHHHPSVLLCLCPKREDWKPSVHAPYASLPSLICRFQAQGHHHHPAPARHAASTQPLILLLRMPSCGWV